MTSNVAELEQMDPEQVDLNRHALRVALTGSVLDLDSILSGEHHQETEEEQGALEVDTWFQDPVVPEGLATWGLRPLMSLLHYAALAPLEFDPIEKVDHLIEAGCIWNAVDVDGNVGALTD